MMPTRVAGVLLTLLLLVPAAASAVTIDQIVAMSRAGVSDAAIVALIERDRSVFALDAAQVVELQQAGVSEAVTVAMIRSGEAPAAAALPGQIVDSAPGQPPVATYAYAVPYAVVTGVPVRRGRAVAPVVTLPDAATSFRAVPPATSSRGIFFTQPTPGMFFSQSSSAQCPAPATSQHPK